jgi:hypothetical protein
VVPPASAIGAPRYIHDAELFHDNAAGKLGG